VEDAGIKSKGDFHPTSPSILLNPSLGSGDTYPMTPNKLMTRFQARSWREALRREGKTVVFANGCFDILHGGHVSYFEDARSRGDALLVAVNSDTSMQALKGPSRPIVPEQDRIEVLNALRAIDALVLFDEPTVEPLLRLIRPDFHAKGTDYTAENVPERQIAEELGIKIIICGPPKENATRSIIATILDRYGNPA
jgi:rfaE bifunctional protein nucleotidyltransferase chain/domain